MAKTAARNYCQVQRLAAAYLLAWLVVVTARSPEFAASQQLQVSLFTAGKVPDSLAITGHSPDSKMALLYLPSPTAAQLHPAPTAAVRADIQGLAVASSTETSTSTSTMTLTPTVTITITTPTPVASSTSSTTTSGAIGGRNLHPYAVQLLSGLLILYLVR